MLFALYIQDLDPCRFRLTSTLLAALPVLVLFYLLVGRRWLASWAGAAGAGMAIVIASGVYGMPAEMAGWAFVHGAVFGLLPIGWTVFAAMLLYNVTVETGQFDIIRRSIGDLSGDARVQAVMIGFAFGAFMEGAAGAGSPVAICSAMLVGLGVPHFRAAVLCLIANTSPVAYGGIGVPLITLASTSGLPGDTLSIMAGHQLPIISCIIPLYMVKCMCTWRETFAVWPALVVAGGSFAVFQYFFATAHAYGLPPVWQLTDIGGGLFSLVALAIFLKLWKPRSLMQNTHPGKDDHENHPRVKPAAILKAWSPFLIMALCLTGSGTVRQMESNRDRSLDIGIARTYYEMEVPELHRSVVRAERLRKPGATEEESREDAKIKMTWVTAPGTPVFIAALVSMVMLRMTRQQVANVFRKTCIQMKVPIPTIACMLGLSYVSKYAGMDATLGVAIAGTGAMYPFFAAILGWLGVFLTGTDAGSNALFGSLQKITATEIHAAGHLPDLTLEQAQVLICTANSTGGVMGKMIDAQSICVATAGTNQIGKEADIFKAVIGHSILLACVVGLLTALQAFVPPFTRMVPSP